MIYEINRHDGELPTLIICKDLMAAKTYIRIDLDENLSNQRLNEKFIIITHDNQSDKATGRYFQKCIIFTQKISNMNCVGWISERMNNLNIPIIHV